MPQDAVDRLFSILDLEQLDIGLFRGTGAGGETPERIFGGQVISQALRAAYHSVEGRDCHSLHAYFMRPGDPAHPVIYHVDNSRDGGSFTTRRVVAQQKGEQILVLTCSFHKQEPGFEYQHPMPEGLPEPESLPTRETRIAALHDRLSPEQIARLARADSSIEICEVRPRDPLTPSIDSDNNAIWFRLARPVEAPQILHHCFLAYASDLYLLPSALRPMGESQISGNIMIASLDHAMWFHRRSDFSNWHLYQMDSPSVGGARGFNRGTIFDRSGRLVASTAQEGLVRKITRK